MRSQSNKNGIEVPLCIFVADSTEVLGSLEELKIKGMSTRGVSRLPVFWCTENIPMPIWFSVFLARKKLAFSQ